MPFGKFEKFATEKFEKFAIEKFDNLLFGKFVKLAIWKIRKICNFGNFKKVDLEHSEKI